MLLLTLLAIAKSHAAAQEASPPEDASADAVAADAAEGVPAASESVRLLDREPFDRITLDEANGNAVLNTVLLDLPDRKLPDPIPTTGELVINQISQPGIPYALKWEAIAKIELYEQMLLEEAKRLTESGAFPEAFDYLSFLRANYPDFPGLEPLLQDYLWRDASTTFAGGDPEGAWPALVALYGRNSDYPRLVNAVQAVSDALINRRLQEKNYAAARAVLELVERHFPELELANIARWRERFAGDARAQLAKAAAALEARDYDDARDAALYAYAIVPDFEEARDMVRAIQAAAPEIRVGVTQAVAPNRLSQTPSWAAARGIDLVDPRLVAMRGFGAEGGEYACPFGDLSTSDSGLETTLRLSPDALRRGVAPAAIALEAVRMATPGNSDFQQDVSSVLKGLAIADGRDVNVAWHWSRLHPEALLQTPLRRLTTADQAPGLWLEPLSANRDADAIRYQRTGAAEAADGAVRFVIEQVYSDDEAALTALTRGEVDAVDRVPPWQLERMQQAADVVVGQYRLPTVHVLVVNPSTSLLATREFRRALCFGIDREGIVKDIILGGELQPGFRTLSGPFPAGASVNDPVGYAYNSELAPRPYEPRLAALLANVARTTLAKRAAEEAKAAAEAKGEEPPAVEPDADDSAATDAATEKKPPEPEPLVLAHPADSIARICCQSIKLQLDKVGVPIKLVELPANDAAAMPDYDLLYVELAVREPLLDARRTLAGDGVAGKASALMMAALDELDRAENWNDARLRLRNIHRLAHYDLPVIPLWQTVNYFAHRTWLAGVSQQPVSLYQDLPAWRKQFDQPPRVAADGP
jgi:hypothetical protein